MFMCELRIRLTEEGGSVGIVKGAVRPGIGRASDFSGISALCTSAMIVIVKADSNVFGAPIEGGSSAIVGTACGVHLSQFEAWNVHPVRAFQAT